MSSNAPAQTSSHKGVNPVFAGTVGVILVLLWLMVAIFQVETSEALILGGGRVSFEPDWNILLQLPNLIQGHLLPALAKAALFAWIIEFIYLVCVVGYRIAHETVTAHNQHLARWFGTGVFLTVVYQFVSDFQYSPSVNGIWPQIAFAGAMSFAVMFFGVVGVKMIAVALAEWKH